MAGTTIDAQKHVIGNAIAKRRKILHLEQQEVSDMTGVSVATLSRLESGKGNISMANILTVLELLGMELLVDVKQTV